MVYDHVVGSYWYRIKNTNKFKNHAGALFSMAIEEFKKHVPDVPHSAYEGNPFADVPNLARMRSALGILASQTPWHDPTFQPLPEFYDEWVGRHRAGDDVTRLYGQPPMTAENAR